MNILKEIFAHEVFPAMGCTEPISCAYAVAAAAEQLPGPVERVELIVDPGTFKNGAAVTVPHSDGEKGNVIAAALGAVIASSSSRLELLKDVTPGKLSSAKELIRSGVIRYRCKEDEKDFHVEVVAEGGGSRVRCVIADGHTNIVRLDRDGTSLLASHPHAGAVPKKYRERVGEMGLEDLLRDVTALDDNLRDYIRRGIEMNMAISEKGLAVRRTAYQLQKMKEEGIVAEDLFYTVKFRVAAAVDARMAGVPQPVMTSGGSGNQGVVAILVPYLVGRARGVEPARVEESIAVSHALNSYVKSFTGELSVICGCAIAAGIAAAAALVYQQAGIEMDQIGSAVNNVIGDLSGLICDGAKPGCSMKTVSATDTAMRSAFMALSGYGLSGDDGVVGTSPEDSIRNLSRISLEGMFRVDPTVVRILQDKAAARGRA
ncbi:MAG: L-serine ammonia-lyase, iron-sulfur-dependent, subunit alpha [PVC group bacterium]